MLDRKMRILTVLCLIIMTAVQFVSAEDNGKLTIYNTKLVTNEKNATYIEGELSAAEGQIVFLKDGLRKIAEKKMPASGTRSRFKIRVPAENIDDKGITVLFVDVKDAKGSDYGKERVEIEYNERQKQKIKTASKEYELTFPGEDTAIDAVATSGGDLIYSSSDPDIVTVDESGNIATSGSGEAEIQVKQIGNSRFKEAEKTIKVSVKAIDAYSVTFHSSDEQDASYKQVIEIGSGSQLQENSFENGSHEFLGWATSDEGLMEYLDSSEVKDLAGAGENVDLYAVWSGDGIRGAIAWAEKIAADDSFSYGKRPKTNRIGCYFCGTNQRNKPKGYEKTYVCVTFVHAAFAHGAEDPEILADCKSGKHCISMSDTNFSRYSCWKKVGRASSLSVSDLQPGDVIIAYAPNNYGGHAALYIGDNRIVDASGNGWGASTIAVRGSGSGARMLNYARKHSGQSFVMRYVGPNA